MIASGVCLLPGSLLFLSSHVAPSLVIRYKEKRVEGEGGEGDASFSLENEEQDGYALEARSQKDEGATKMVIIFSFFLFFFLSFPPLSSPCGPIRLFVCF